jgi:hypothetical protein
MAPQETLVTFCMPGIICGTTTSPRAEGSASCPEELLLQDNTRQWRRGINKHLHYWQLKNREMVSLCLSLSLCLAPTEIDAALLQFQLVHRHKERKVNSNKHMSHPQPASEPSEKRNTVCLDPHATKATFFPTGKMFKSRGVTYEHHMKDKGQTQAILSFQGKDSRCYLCLAYDHSCAKKKQKQEVEQMRSNDCERT